MDHGPFNCLHSVFSVDGLATEKNTLGVTVPIMLTLKSGCRSTDFLLG